MFLCLCNSIIYAGIISANTNTSSAGVQTNKGRYIH